MIALNGNNDSGKIFVKGKAVKEYTCDMIEITIQFRSRGISGAKESKTVIKQCELFLQRLEEMKFDISKIRLQNDEIDQSSYHEDGKSVASRTLEFDCEANASIVNLILKLIQDEHFDANISTIYYLSNEEYLRKQLREAAVLDSKANAELLARAADKKIIGVDTIDMTHHELHMARPSRHARRAEDEWDDLFQIFGESSKLSMPRKKLEEEVSVVWLLK